MGDPRAHAHRACGDTIGAGSSSTAGGGTLTSDKPRSSSSSDKAGSLSSSGITSGDCWLRGFSVWGCEKNFETKDASAYIVWRGYGGGCRCRAWPSEEIVAYMHKSEGQSASNHTGGCHGLSSALLSAWCKTKLPLFKACPKEKGASALPRQMPLPRCHQPTMLGSS